MKRLLGASLILVAVLMAGGFAALAFLDLAPPVKTVEVAIDDARLPR